MFNVLLLNLITIHSL